MQGSKKRSVLATLLLSVAMLVATMAPAMAEEHAQDAVVDGKIWVCKYVGVPGGTVSHIINPSVNSLPSGVEPVVGAQWQDAHGQKLGSIVVAPFSTIEDCPGEQPEEPGDVLDADVTVSSPSICLGDEITVTLHNLGSSVAASFSGQLTWPGVPSPLAVGPYVVPVGESSPVGPPFSDTPSVLGTYTINWTATGGDGLIDSGSVSFNVTDCSSPETCPPGMTGTPPNCVPPPPPPSTPGPDPVVSVSALGSQICPDGVTNQIDYLIGGANWVNGTLTVGDSVVPVTPGSFGSLPWPTDGDGLLVASVVGTLQVDGQAPVEFGPLSPDDDCLEVLEAVEEEPEAEEDTEVLDETESLPRTGASTILLTLLGLMSLASGGALLGRRSRR